MDSQEATYLKLDQEFDRYLAEMKPHVLKLPHKTDRQKCAVWIKKLCEPTSGLMGRKTRNMYGQLMLHMLKRGVLEGPFTSKPQEGPLSTLPSYMSVYLDEPGSSTRNVDSETNKVPDWVAGELTASVGSSLFKSSIGNPAAHSTWRSGLSPEHSSPRRRPLTSLGIDLDKDPIVGSSSRDYLHDRGPDIAQYSFDDLNLGRKKSQKSSLHFLDDSVTNYDKLRKTDFRSPKKTTFAETTVRTETTDWSQATVPLTSSLSNPYLKGSNYTDDSSTKGQSREVEMRTKMLEAKFHEEKLRLQQKHDAAVQKILDRKNAEIEDVKAQYRSKAKELEDTIAKLEKKIQTTMKESSHVKDTKDKQIQELKRMLEETTDDKKNEFEKKINDIVAEFEQEKFEMQKQHTRNIQEILDDTNARLQKMEKEYNQQAISTSNVIKELETRVQQLMSEATQMKKSKSALEKEKMNFELRIEELQSELRTHQDRAVQMEQEHQRALEAHDQDLRTLHRKTESSMEIMKQEHSIAAAKSKYATVESDMSHESWDLYKQASESIGELEQHVDQLKKALKDAEEQRQRQLRELEQLHSQDKFHTHALHEKQISSVKKEIDQVEHEMQKKLKSLEHIIREKEDEIKRLVEKNKQQADQAEKALEDFKLQVEKNQNRMYDEMKQQMMKVEADLNKSKQAREKQAKEYSKQLEEEKARHEREVMELKMTFEQEKAQMLKDFHQQKEYIHAEHEREMESLKESHRLDIADLERRSQARQDKDAKKISGLEQQVSQLKDEVVQANQLRKQQLVELGLLREEEKQKMQRDHETELSHYRSELEQQRLELQKTHSTEMEQMLEKTNERLKGIEKEYTERANKATEIITELQATVTYLREDIKRLKETSDKKIADLTSRYEEEKKTLKRQYSSNLSTVQKELDSQYTKVRSQERQLEKQEAESEEKITHLKLSYEERMRGLIPASVRQELEDTISSLKSQVNSLQQKALILQEELEMNSKYPMGTIAAGMTSSPIKSA